MNSKSLHVLVIGGGIGGLCLAQGLKQQGISVAVYERNPTAVDWLQGYRIHINPVGSRALHACLPAPLWEIFAAVAGKPPAGLGFMTDQMQELLVVGETWMAESRPDLIDGHRPISRITLRHILQTGLQDVIHFGKTFERYELLADGCVIARFSDGTTASGDLLVGADGANSKVRQQRLPHAQRLTTAAMGIGGKLILTDEVRDWLPRPIATRMNLIMPSRDFTLFNAAYDRLPQTPEAIKKICEQAEHVGLDHNLLFDQSPNYLLWAMIAHRKLLPENAEGFDGKALQRFVGEKVEHWHPDLRRMIADSDAESVSLMTMKTSTPVPAWQTSQVTLLGDALHNMTPVGGLGANTALYDANLLTCQLAAVQNGTQPLLSAIQAYESGMRAIGFTAVRASLQNMEQAISTNRIARMGGQTWFRLCNHFPPLKRSFEATWSAPIRAALETMN